MAKNIIMGIYDYGNAPIQSYKGGIYAFMKSLRQHNTNCEVVILSLIHISEPTRPY